LTQPPDCYGNKIVRTPDLDRLVAQGTRLDRALLTAWYSPSRQSLITGKLPTPSAELPSLTTTRNGERVSKGPKRR
jgi:arylsulfatase A-like enzyme